MSKQAYSKDIEEKTYGGIAMALTNFSKRAQGLCNKFNCTLIGINQLRAKMDSQYGGTDTTGGLAWKFNVSLRMEFRQGQFFDEHYTSLSRGAENPVGNYVMATVAKNKTGSPRRHTGFYTLRYDICIDYLYDLTEVCIKSGVIEKSGSWFAIKRIENVWNDEKDRDIPTVVDENVVKLQGQYAVSEYLSDEEHFDVLKSLEDYLDYHVRYDK